MYKSISISLLAACAALFWFKPVQAGTLFFDDMESGEGNWTHTGLWHLQANPDDIAISGEINPALVSLPDFGYLPSAYLGDYVWWYGDPDNGTFLGEWDLASQTAKNGGTSDAANYGELVSESIDLTGAEAANLTFWNWWEIEGVDVDRYDLMSVYVTIDNGETWEAVANLNPINDVDGEAWRPYSSGGLGQVGQWIHTQADLSAYVGNTIKLKFYFETVDEKYNGFRGWLIDDVRITNDVTVKPSFDSQTSQASASCGGDSGGEINTPARMYLYRSQQVQVTSAGPWYITPFGSNDVVATGTAGIISKIFLNAGYYVLWVTLPEGETCPDATLTLASANYYGGPGQGIAYPGGLVWVYGDNFVAGSTVSFIEGSEATAIQTVTEADTVVVVSTNEIQFTVPSTLATGTYGIRVTAPNGKKATIANALTITTDTPPDIDSVSPEEVDDAATTMLTIIGTGFVDGAVVAVGGVPLLDLTVTDTTITGTLPAGASSGFQNVDVINPDGQQAELIGGVSVADTSTTGYVPSGEQLTKPKKVKGVTVTFLGATKVKVTWKKATGVDHYYVELKRGSKVIDTYTSNTKSKIIKGLKDGKHYSVQVKAVGTYLGGQFSKRVRFSTF